MDNALDYIEKDLPRVKGHAPVAEVLEALLQSRCSAVLLTGEGKIKKVVTAFSLINTLENEVKKADYRAEDLPDGDLPVVSWDSTGRSWIPLLKKSEALVVTGEVGEIAGAITVSGMYDKLVAKTEELERELDAIINFSSDEILVADGRGAILRVNSVFEENFGAKLSDVLGKSVDELEKKRVFFPSVTRLVLESKSSRTVIQSQRDGRKLLATGTPVFNEEGSIFRVVVNTRDITRLNNLKKQLEEAELLKNRYRQELIELRQDTLWGGDIIAVSPAMKRLLEMVGRIAAADSTVLLTGESGSGKGMIARYIHDNSLRRGKPFTVVNCGAIPENLLESELFGYEGGAFTGARREGKVGKLELANEGTLFLDEITELPLELQVKLLHVLQEGLITKVGGTREIKLNLRFIAATNRDITALVEKGLFREDLYYRLDVIPLTVPPLRERREDIRPLAEAFLEKLGEKYHSQKYFTAEAYAYLENYEWPGNVRELENLVERLMIVVDGAQIDEQNLPRHVLQPRGLLPQREIQEKWECKNLSSLKKAREELEKKMLSAALRSCRTTYEMARVLGIDQSTVVRKLHRYKLIEREKTDRS
ncbi:MAG: sigma 54-interacting transcriptional regulator [Bacillota bacterium]|nr:sigma 54-interacting transcriptional regulator [Bacillota bacterium]